MCLIVCFHYNTNRLRICSNYIHYVGRSLEGHIRFHYSNMLILPLKPAVRYDLQSALARWLDSDHHIAFEPKNPLQFILPKPEFSSAACRNELLRVQALRNSLSDSFLKPNSHKAALEEGALEDSHEYHAILLEFEKQGFPSVDDSETHITLTWKGAWSPQQETHASLVWDRANTVFNIAALLSQRAADASPSDREACKQAVSYSQSAASLLNVLRELVQSQDFATVDLSNSMLTFWERQLLAQAQNFVYRMASLAPSTTSANSSNDDTATMIQKHTTLSVLAQSAHELYNEALTAAQEPRLVSEVPKQSQEEWAPYCKAISMLTGARAEYHQAVVHRLKCEWGKEIARLKVCQEKLTACKEFCASFSDGSIISYTKRECQAIAPVVTDRLHEADQDNYKIYQDQIPKQMPDIKGKQLAKLSGNLPESMLVPKTALFVNL